MDVIMDTIQILNSINRLLSDVYHRDTRISTLLTGYLDKRQMQLIKTEKLDEFLQMVLSRFQLSTEK